MNSLISLCELLFWPFTSGFQPLRRKPLLLYEIFYFLTTGVSNNALYYNRPSLESRELKLHSKQLLKEDYSLKFDNFDSIYLKVFKKHSTVGKHCQRRYHLWRLYLQLLCSGPYETFNKECAVFPMNLSRAVTSVNMDSGIAIAFVH